MKMVQRAPRAKQRSIVVRYTIYITKYLTQRYNNTIQINPRLECEYGRIKYKSNDKEEMK